ncbi:MAG TPA: PD-(D/E)XK nuclease family protein, partial [Opitutaceae bacterium]
MEIDLQLRGVTLSVGEFANFSTTPAPGGDGTGGGVWRAQLGSHWHRELRERDAADPAVKFEVAIEGDWLCRGWKLHLSGRIDQTRESPGALLVREIKTVMQSLPTYEVALRADYPEYFIQLATYVFLTRLAEGSSEGGARCPQRAQGVLIPAEAGRPTSESKPPLGNSPRVDGELVFVEAGTGFIQTVALGCGVAAVVEQQADRLVDFLENRREARERRLTLEVSPAF